MRKMLLTIVEYLMHASTWKGILAVMVSMGVALKPELQAAIISLGMAAVGMIQILIDDADKDALAEQPKE